MIYRIFIIASILYSTPSIYEEPCYNMFQGKTKDRRLLLYGRKIKEQCDYNYGHGKVD